MLAALVVVAFFLPREPEVSRSVDIAAPPSLIFPIASDLRRFREWSPWLELDPATTYTFTGPTEGVGQTMTWASKDPTVGSGSMAVTLLEPGNLVEMSLAFGRQANARSWIHLTPNGGTTRVTWGFATDTGFNPVARYLGLVLDRAIGPDYERGLARLKAAAEAECQVTGQWFWGLVLGFRWTLTRVWVVPARLRLSPPLLTDLRPPAERHVAGLCSDPFQPGTDAGIDGKVEAAFIGDVGVGIECDIGDRVGGAGQPVVCREPFLHDRKGPVAALVPVGDLLRCRLADAVRIDRQPGARHRDARLVLVLLEEEPLIDRCHGRIGRRAGISSPRRDREASRSIRVSAVRPAG